MRGFSPERMGYLLSFGMTALAPLHYVISYDQKERLTAITLMTCLVVFVLCLRSRLSYPKKFVPFLMSLVAMLAHLLLLLSDTL